MNITSNKHTHDCDCGATRTKLNKQRASGMKEKKIVQSLVCGINKKNLINMFLPLLVRACCYFFFFLSLIFYFLKLFSLVYSSVSHRSIQ